MGDVICMNVNVARVVQDFEVKGTSQILSGVLPWAIDPDLADRLWLLSEQLTGVRFP